MHPDTLTPRSNSPRTSYNLPSVKNQNVGPASYLSLWNSPMAKWNTLWSTEVHLPLSSCQTLGGQEGLLTFSRIAWVVFQLFLRVSCVPSPDICQGQSAGLSLSPSTGSPIKFCSFRISALAITTKLLLHLVTAWPCFPGTLPHLVPSVQTRLCLDPGLNSSSKPMAGRVVQGQCPDLSLSQY